MGKVDIAIKRLKEFEPREGYYLAFSGGKDSCVLKSLADKAGVKYRAVYRVTSVDPPELVRFIKEEHKDVKREVPLYDNGKPITMWNLIPKMGMPPTCKVRYCCERLKESGGDGNLVLTGVRWEESYRRRINSGLANIKDNSKIKGIEFGEDFEKRNKGIVLINDNDESRRLIEFCYKRTKTTLNPIIDWNIGDVWGYIVNEKIKYCELYDEGFERLGCIGCPLATKEKRKLEFERWPKYKEAYLLAFGKLSEKLKKQGKLENSKFGETAETMFQWWMRD